jgi:hypothetical protein
MIMYYELYLMWVCYIIQISELPSLSESGGGVCIIYPKQNIGDATKMSGFKAPSSGVHPAIYAMRMFRG